MIAPSALLNLYQLAALLPDLFEVPGGVDVGADAEPEHGGVLAVQHQGAVDDVEEEQQVALQGGGGRHALEHRRHQLNNTCKTSNGTVIKV